MTLAYHYVLPMNEIASASSSSKDFRHAVAALYCDRLLGWPGRRGRLAPGDVLNLHLAQWQRPDRPESLLRDGARWTLSGRTLPGPPPVSNSGQCRPLAGHLGHRLDACRHVLDRRAARRSRRAGLV